MTGDARGVADVLLAHHRLHAVGADQGAAAPLAAVLVDGGDPAVILFDPGDAGRGEELDILRLLHTLEQRGVHIDPVDHRIRIAEALAECLAGGNAADAVFVEGIVHHHLVGIDGAGPGPRPDAQGVERGKGVGAELHAGADLTDLRRLFKHLHLETAADQCEGGGQAANATAGDQDRQGSRSTHDCRCRVASCSCRVVFVSIRCRPDRSAVARMRRLARVRPGVVLG